MNRCRTRVDSTDQRITELLWYEARAEYITRIMGGSR